MNAAADHKALFSENNKRSTFSLMFDVTIAVPLSPTALARAGTEARLAIEEAVKVEDTKYGVTYRPTYKSIPMAFSECGNHLSSV